MIRVLAVLSLLCLCAAHVFAQGGETSENPAVSPWGVYVTTQDALSLRIGPGTGFDRITVVPAVTTLPAVGRSPRGNWIQVVYAGQRGWLAARYLVWSGNLTLLPVSTMDEQVAIVRTGAIGFVPADTPLFDSTFRLVRRTTAGQRVELTGRLGSGVYIWIQVDYNGTPYWVRSWEIDYDREYLFTLDAAYLIPYTRLARGLNADIGRVGERLTQIERVWLSLRAGEGVSCRNINPTRRTTQDGGVRQEPIFLPVIAALDAAVLEINRAISAYNDACARPAADAFLTDAEVIAALTGLTDARRSLVLADSLAAALFNRDPIVAASRGGR
jgi:uncharacterized protein YraI